MLREYLLQRYPDGLDRRRQIRDFVESICQWFVDAGLSDNEFLIELCSGSEAVFWQRLTEVLLAVELHWAGLPVRSVRPGPDFLIERPEGRIWIEAICPEPSDVPTDWLQFAAGEVNTFPDRAILLRWTAAIAAKAEKLFGNPQKNFRGYLQKGIVSIDDAYVIAVNGRRLRDVFPQLNGINGYPFAVEATLGVGYRRIHIDRESRQIVDSDHEHRPFVTRVREGENATVSIPTCTFLDDSWAGVSAIWATDIDDSHILGNGRQIAVVHNPKATNPVPTGVLPAFTEYVATPNAEGFVLNGIDGRLVSH